MNFSIPPDLILLICIVPALIAFYVIYTKVGLVDLKKKK